MYTFPTPYKDEIFYSVLARYSVRSGHPKFVSNLDDLYGHRRVVPTFDIPSNLNLICSRLPDKSMITPDLIIKYHSLIPFFTAFLNNEEKINICNNLKDGNTSGTYMKIAILNQGGPISTYFHHCPQCIKEDLENHGETYWHREHHINGMFVCLRHQEILQSTNILVKGANRQKLIPASMDSLKYMKSYSFSDLTFNQLFSLSKDISNLLNADYPSTSQIKITQTFNEKLIERGYAKLNNFTHQRSLINDFNHFYGDEFLNLFSCKIDDLNNNWLTTLVRKNERKQYAIKYLLLARFLGIYLEELFSISTSGTIVSTQNEWDINLIELASHRISIRQISKVIGASNSTISKAFKRLGVEPYWNLEQVSRKNHSTYIESDRFKNLLISRRMIWQNLLSENSQLGTGQIKLIDKESSKIYYWLVKYDNEWLKVNHRKSVITEKIVDWKQREDEYYPLVEALIKELKCGKPEKVSCNTIASRLGIKGWLCKSIDKVPKIKALISDNCQTTDQLRVRKIKWAYEQLVEESKLINISNLSERSGINSRRIKQYLDIIQHLETDSTVK